MTLQLQTPSVPEMPALDPGLFVDVDLFGQAMKADPSQWFLEWAQKPPFYVWVNGRPNAVISRHEQVKWAFTDYETISATPQAGWGIDMFDYFDGMRIITEYDPPEHASIRRLIQPGFTPRRIAAFDDGINQLVDEFIDQISTRQQFDLIGDFASPLVYRMLLGAVLGIPEADWPIFTRLSNAFELVATVPVGGEKPAEYRAAFSAARDYCEKLIEARRQRPIDDLIGTVIDACDEAGAINTDDLFSILIQLFTGGLGTIIATTGLCMLRLLRSPDQLQLLRDDMSLLNSAIEECLRIDSLGNFRHRYVVKDCVVDGTPLYRGMVVHLSMGASNYDPDFYPEPGTFDIRRNPKDISTFGHSAHFCVGNILARKVLRRIVGQMLTRFPTIRLSDPDATIVYGGMPTERFPVSVKLSID